MQRYFLLAAVTTILMFSPSSPAQPPVPALRKLTEFDLPGPPGKRFDYLTIDPDDRYLISAHLAAGQTYVIDLRTNQFPTWDVALGRTHSLPHDELVQLER